MDYRDQLEDRIKDSGLRFFVWGESGPELVNRIDQALGVRVQGELRDFIEEVGNLRIDPFLLNVAGDDSGNTGIVPSTLAQRVENPDLSPLLVQITDHAGEVYLLDTESGWIFAYDALRVIKGEETLRWKSLAEFIEWVIQEAGIFQRDEM